MSNQFTWSKFFPASVSANLDYPDVSLPYFLEQASLRFPNRPAVLFQGKKLTYKIIWDEACRFAHMLTRMGITDGDRVAIILPNTPQSIIGYYGTLLAGGVAVPFNPLYSEREIHHQVQDSGIRFMLCLDLLYPRVKNATEGLEIDRVIVTSIKDYLPFPKNLIYPFITRKNGQAVSISYNEKVCSYKTEMSDHAPSNLVLQHHNRSSKLAMLQYTGGTTGISKGVMLTHGNLVANTMQAKAWMYQCEEGKESILCVLPFFHVYGMSMGMNLAVMNASTMILLPRFIPEDVLKTIQREKPTLFPGAPTMYIALINHPNIQKYDLSSIKACISGSAPLPLEVQETFEKLTGGRLVEGYGLTESSPVTHCNPIWDYRKNGSIGIPWSDTEAKVIDPETFEEMPIGAAGDLIVKGPQVMLGYWNRPEETANTIRDGWLLTGDIAIMDEAGFFSIVDRRKDMIIAGGYNIYPREVEEVLYEHQKVKEAAVIGVPDPYRGETVKAFIVCKENQNVTTEELNQFCLERLAKYKVPKLYEFRTDLPKTMVGKVLKRVLIEEEEAKRQSAAAEQPEQQ